MSAFGSRLGWMTRLGHVVDWQVGETEQKAVRVEDTDRDKRLGDQAIAAENLRNHTALVEARAQSISKEN